MVSSCSATNPKRSSRSLIHTRIVECTHTSLYAAALYNMTVDNFGNSTELSSLTDFAWSWSVLLGGIVTGCVQVCTSAYLYQMKNTC